MGNKTYTEEQLEEEKNQAWLGGQKQVIEQLLKFIEKNEIPTRFNSTVQPDFQRLITLIRDLQRK